MSINTSIIPYIVFILVHKSNYKGPTMLRFPAIIMVLNVKGKISSLGFYDEFILPQNSDGPPNV